MTVNLEKRSQNINVEGETPIEKEVGPVEMLALVEQALTELLEGAKSSVAELNNTIGSKCKDHYAFETTLEATQHVETDIKLMLKAMNKAKSGQPVEIVDWGKLGTSLKLDYNEDKDQPHPNPPVLRTQQFDTSTLDGCTDLLSQLPNTIENSGVQCYGNRNTGLKLMGVTNSLQIGAKVGTRLRALETIIKNYRTGPTLLIKSGNSEVLDLVTPIKAVDDNMKLAQLKTDTAA